MFNDWHFARLNDPTDPNQDLAKRMEERRRSAHPAHKPSLGARVARRLLALAVATDRQETCKLVWERLEAKG